MPTILHYLKKHRGKLTTGLLLLVGTNLLSLSIPQLLKLAVEEMKLGLSLRRVGYYCLAIAAVASGQAILRTLSRLLILGLSRRVSYDLRNRLFSHLLSLPPAFFDRTRTGDLMSRAVNDMQSVRSLFGPGVMNLMNTTMVYGFGLVLMAMIDLKMTLLALIPYPLLLVAIQRLGRMVHKRTNKVQEQLSAISAGLQENLSGIHLVRVFSQEEREIERFDRLSREYRNRNLRLAVARGAIVSLMGGIGGLGTVVVLWLGGLYVLDGRITLGDFVAFNGYLAILAWPTIALGWVINTFQRGLAALGRISEILREEPQAATNGDHSSRAVIRGEWEMRDLDFRYPGASQPALSAINLKIPAGSFAAVVGPVGSGKSTLVHLMSRLYAPTSGSILLDGRNLEEIPLGEVRRNIGVAPQEAFLFSKSLRENIALGLENEDPDRVLDAGRISQLEEEVSAMPSGWDTVVGERGYTLSGGQRQRAALARALAPRPPIVILDDSLSSLDAETEQAVMGRIRAEMKGRTLILITHRMTSVLGADWIFVLRQGRLVEEGRGEDLLRTGGLFAELYRKQQLDFD